MTWPPTAQADHAGPARELQPTCGLRERPLVDVLRLAASTRLVLIEAARYHGSDAVLPPVLACGQERGRPLVRRPFDPAQSVIRPSAMTTIREKVSALDALRRELRESFGVGTEEHRLFPPPAPGEVRAHERRTGRALPPSFKAFLELANGWSGFMKGFSLLGLRRRETELLFREGLDEKLLASLPDLVPDHELRSLAAREKTDPKVLSPRDRLVLGVDGRGSALVFDERSVTEGEPAVALVKYVWVQRSWPSFAALLDDAIGEAQAELDKRKELAAAGKAGKKGAEKKAAKRSPGDESAKLKRRVVEIRPSKAPKKKPATKKSAAGSAKPANATKPTKAPKPAKKKPAPKKSRR